MEQAKALLKRVLKIAFKAIAVALLPVFLFVSIIVVLLAAATYFITIDDGIYKDKDWSNTPFAAAEYMNQLMVEGDELKSNTTLQELWDKMLENNSRVDEYLDSPEELAMLMKAEIVTQYPDIRSNPDEEINWEDIVENPDTLQGIIKFNRAGTNGEKTRMTYVDPETFQSYIDEYNSSGSETAKQNALTHFTLKKTTASDVQVGGGLVAAGEGVMTSVSQAIIDATNRVPWPGVNWCAAWVNRVYDNAGVTSCSHATAYESYQHHCISTDKTAIPIGASVFGTGSSSGGAGHVGIYIGGGNVIDSKGSAAQIDIQPLEEWISWQTDVIDGKSGWLGWGWADGNMIRGTTLDPDMKDYKPNDDDKSDEQKKEDEEIKKNNAKKGQITNVSGDGYSQEYTSSAGITYQLYRQYEGSYSNDPYWDGIIHYKGSGPTAIAILSGALTTHVYDPGDIASQMGGESARSTYQTLKQEMDSLGMSSEIVHNPTSQNIQDNLRNGKVMLVSVNNNTVFSDDENEHIIAIVDINAQGQVYVINPGSSSVFGWYDVSEVMKGCSYMVETQAEAAGIADSTNNSKYVVVVATWKQVDTLVTTTDPNVDAASYSSTEYTMTTTNVNYQEMVEPYTMPFDMLWALLVVGEDKDFIFEIANLIYNSDIEITVHDNLTTNIDVDEWHYTQRTRADVYAYIVAKCEGQSTSGIVGEHTHDPDPNIPDKEYVTTKTVITQTNTITTALTRANVWIVDYQNDYTYDTSGGSENKSTINKDDETYSDTPSSTGNSYSCEHIDSKKEELRLNVIGKAIDSGDNSVPSVTFDYNIDVEYYTKYINIYDNVKNTVTTQRYVAGTPTLKEKTDKKSDEPNFVTIFNKGKYSKNRSAIKDASSWFFEIIETNESTADMLDLMKYLLYKATGVDYGVTEFDFNIFYPSTLITAGEGDYVVDITKSPSNIVIKDLETLKLAFSGYSNDRVLQQYAYYFLECQEKYNVNAVFAAAVSITESSAGTNIAIGGNNMFSISSGGQRKLE